MLRHIQEPCINFLLLWGTNCHTLSGSIPSIISQCKLPCPAKRKMATGLGCVTPEAPGEENKHSLPLCPLKATSVSWPLPSSKPEIPLLCPSLPAHSRIFHFSLSFTRTPQITLGHVGYLHASNSLTFKTRLTRLFICMYIHVST